MSSRLRRIGVRMLLTDEATVDYVARADLRTLCRYAYKTGWWNGRTARMGLSVMQPHHFVPAAFVLGLCASIGGVCFGRERLGVVALGAGSAVLAIHQALAVLADVGDEPDLRPIERVLMGPTTLAFHVAYGVGTLDGLARPGPSGSFTA